MTDARLSTIILAKEDTSELRKLVRDALRHSEEVIVVSSGEKIDFSHSRVRSLQRELDDFSSQRNFALQKAAFDWAFFIDADEEIKDSLWTEIWKHIRSKKYDALMFRRHDFFLGRILQYGEVGSVRLLRCARIEVGKGKWRRPVHEVWDIPSHNIGELEIPILHKPTHSVGDFLAKLHTYAALEPKSRDQYSAERVVIEMLLFPAAKFLQNYIWRLGFLDAWQGFFHACLMSYYSFITRVMIYEANITE